MCRQARYGTSERRKEGGPGLGESQELWRRQHLSGQHRLELGAVAAVTDKLYYDAPHAPRDGRRVLGEPDVDVRRHTRVHRVFDDEQRLSIEHRLESSG